MLSDLGAVSQQPSRPTQASVWIPRPKTVSSAGTKKVPVSHSIFFLKIKLPNPVTRKRPVSISSGEDEGNEKVQVRKRPQKNIRQHSGSSASRKRRDQDTDDDLASDTSSTSDADGDTSTDEEDVGDGADDLRELDDEALASALAFEVFLFFSQQLDLMFIFLASPLGFDTPRHWG